MVVIFCIIVVLFMLIVVFKGIVNEVIELWVLSFLLVVLRVIGIVVFEFEVLNVNK